MVVETGKEINEGEIVCSPALLAMDGGRDVSNVQRVPLSEGLEKTKLIESGVDKNEVIGITTRLGEVFGEVTDSPGRRNRVNPARDTGATLLPSVPQVVPRDEGGDNDNVEVTMPITGGAGDFNDHSASTNTRFPKGSGSEFTEGTGELFQHRREIGLVFDTEGEVFKTFALIQLDGGYQKFKTFAHPTAATN